MRHSLAQSFRFSAWIKTWECFSSTSESDRRKFRESVCVCVLTRLDSGLPTGKNVWTFLCGTRTVQQSTEHNYCPLKTVTCRHFRHSQREKTQRLACDKTGIFIRAPDRLSKMCSVRSHRKGKKPLENLNCFAEVSFSDVFPWEKKTVSVYSFWRYVSNCALI